MIRDLATYERAPDAVVATEAGLREIRFRFDFAGNHVVAHS